MKKILKILGFTIGGIVFLLLLGAGFIAFKPLPSYEVKAPDLQVDVTPDRVLRGKQLAMVSCNHCHLSNGKLEGKLLDEGGGLGDVYGPNITQNAEHGIGSYTDGELFYLLRTGIKRDGQLAFPMMLRSLHIGDEDIYDLIAFLRSDDPMVQPSDAEQPAIEKSFLLRMLYTVAFKPLPYAGEPVPIPAKEDQLAYGKYLVDGKLICFDCHSTSFESNNWVQPEQSVGYLQGGNPMYIKGMPDTVVTPNITLDTEHGIGSWTEQEFLTALTTGKRPDGTVFKYPMMTYSFLDSTDASAIYSYLQSQTGPQLAQSAAQP